MQRDARFNSPEAALPVTPPRPPAGTRQPLLDDLTRIALAAGDCIMEIYARDFDVAHKDDNSPVTEADDAAEAIILAGLAAAAPGVPVISEEAAAAGDVPAFDTRFFLVDPLDGTREFIKRNGEFTVNIALIEHGVPVAGVVYAPAIDRLYRGAAGEGAQEIEVSPPQATGGADARLVRTRTISTRPAPADGLVAIASRSHRDAKTDEFLTHYNVRDIVAAGSSLKFCVVARGDADIYPRHGRTMEWDTAAGHAVLAAAGGTVTRLDGAPLTYGKSADGLANPFFVAKGDGNAR